MPGKQKIAAAFAAVAAAGIISGSILKLSPPLKSASPLPENVPPIETANTEQARQASPRNASTDRSASADPHDTSTNNGAGTGAGGGAALSVHQTQSPLRAFLWRVLSVFGLALAVPLWELGFFLLIQFPFLTGNAPLIGVPFRIAHMGIAAALWIGLSSRIGIAAALLFHFTGWFLLGAAAVLTFYAAVRLFHPLFPTRTYRPFPFWDTAFLFATLDAAVMGFLSLWLCIPEIQAYFPALPRFSILCHIAAFYQCGAACLLLLFCAGSIMRERRRIREYLRRKARREAREAAEMEARKAVKTVEAAARQMADGVFISQSFPRGPARPVPWRNSG